MSSRVVRREENAGVFVSPLNMAPQTKQVFVRQMAASSPVCFEVGFLSVRGRKKNERQSLRERR